MDITYQQFLELQNRVTLLEGGNSTIQVIQEGDVSELSKKFDKLLDYLESFFGVGNIKMTDIKRVVAGTSSTSSSTHSLNTNSTTSSVEIDDLKHDISRLSQSLNATNERVERLLNYLAAWIDVGDNVNMKDIKDTVI